MVAARKGRTCTRCYGREVDVTFTGGNKQCDLCLEEKKRGAQVRSSGWMSRHHDEMMEQKPEGDPVIFVAERRDLDAALIRRMAEAHRDVCRYMEGNKGACPVETPEQVAIKALGDPDESVDRERANRVIVTYLSASIDAATWLGWFYPYSRRKERGWQK